MELFSIKIRCTFQLVSTVLGERKYIQNDKGEYEPFAVFGTTIVPLSQLMAAAVRLQMEEEEKYHPDQPEKSKQIPKTWK